MFEEGIPLPDEIPSQIQSNPLLLDGYTIVKQLEGAERDKPATDEQKRDIVRIRVLAYLILEGPTPQACVEVAKNTVQCPNPDAILALGEKYFSHFIRAFYLGSPTQSLESSGLFEDPEDMIEKPLDDDLQSRWDAKVNALLRDGCRCRVSNIYDPRIGTIAGWRDIVGPDYEVHTTKCIHIIPEGIEQASVTWTILHEFGYPNIMNELKGRSIHRLENILTFDLTVLDEFGHLNLWFEATDTPNKYNVRASPEYRFGLLWNRQVEFTTTRSDLHLPSPDYLAIHAACCRVAHMSGAIGYMYEFHQDLESIKVLSKDGSSADLLDYALCGRLKRRCCIL